MKKGTISILGCGWLGLPLGHSLHENGFIVKGSTTSAEKFSQLANAGILPYRVEITESEAIVDDATFFEAQILVISIPPRRIPEIEKIYPAQINHLIPYILMFGIEKVIFISSTSVYPEMNQNAKEDDIFPPQKESGAGILKAEDLLRTQADFRTTILRFGGLIGKDRNPARFLVKSTSEIANAPVNLIHQDDCIGIISAVIEKNIWGETFNACCPVHPMKKDFYGKASRVSGLPEPNISDREEAWKTVDSSKLIRMLNYQFYFSSPMEYLDALK